MHYCYVCKLFKADTSNGYDYMQLVFENTWLLNLEYTQTLTKGNSLLVQKIWLSS